MAIGSIFAATNTMYAAVAYRSREIADLRRHRFPPGSILLSFIFESVLLGLTRCRRGYRPDAALQRNEHGHIQCSHVQRSRIQDADSRCGGIYATIFALVMGLIGGVAPALGSSTA
jgi:putative ABC transport system permease protein